MLQKRPFEEDETHDFISKHPRQHDYSIQLVSSLECPSEDAGLKHNTSGGGLGGSEKSRTEWNMKHACACLTELPMCHETEIENSCTGCLMHSNSSSTTSSTSEEDVGSGVPSHILFPPNDYNPDHSRRILVDQQEIYSSLLEYPPRKLVPIGRSFQADIPEWGSQGAKNSSNCTDSGKALSFSQASKPNLIDNIDDSSKFSGICIIPMPKLAPSACKDERVGSLRTDCCCTDAHSVRCVRQHTLETRDELCKTLGQEKFFDLGFYEMGEVVAKRWSEEDQQLFHQVVFANPASLGRNFWNYLSFAFPYRTKKEIVSYYFNVFMVQRRAEQNRFDPMNIDSDIDEWEFTDDSGGDEVGATEDDDDSAVESPVYPDATVHQEILDQNPLEYGIVHTASDDYNDVAAKLLETKARAELHKGNLDFTVQLDDKAVSNERGVVGGKDELNTTSDTAAQVARVKADDIKHCTGNFNGMGSGGCQEFLLGPYEAKVWDVEYLTCPKDEFDLLPTCSMIEEVFGVGAWNYQSRDGKGFG